MKTTQEWLLVFNQYYQNITSNKAPGHDAYEISVFLTDAQRAVVLGICNGSLGSTFESTEDVTNYLASLVKQVKITDEKNDPMIEASNSEDDIPYARIAGHKSHIYELPDDLLFKTSEFCTIDTGNCRDVVVAVVPTTQDEYWRTSRNPFKKQNTRKVLRLVYANSEYSYFEGQSVGSGAEQAKELHWKKFSELISDYDIKDYTVRYIKYPEPIILEDLSARGLSIEGKTEECACLLDEALHQAILTRAVQIAQAVWSA